MFLGSISGSLRGLTSLFLLGSSESLIGSHASGLFKVYMLGIELDGPTCKACTQPIEHVICLLLTSIWRL